jgi:diguanylate cyclase (GGDEF)-like protein
MRSADLFGIYVRGLGSLVGARGVTVYVSSPPGSSAQAALSHHGELLPLPELENVAAAEHFLAEILPELGRLKEANPSLEAVEVPSRAPGGRLIGILPRQPERVPDRRQSARRARAAEAQEEAPGAVQTELWLGLRTGDEDPPMPLPPQPAGLRPLEAEWSWLLAFAGEVARHSQRVSLILDDPVTGLAGRAEFQEEVERLMDAALAGDLPLTLLMINPDDFGAVNEHMSREAADDVIREIGARLLDSCRREDLVARYGSVVFASILVDTDAEEGKRRAREILENLHERAFVDGAVRLRFSLGLASLEPGSGVRQGQDLIRRQARRRGRHGHLAAGGRGRGGLPRPADRNLHRPGGQGLSEHGRPDRHHLGVGGERRAAGAGRAGGEGPARGHEARARGPLRLGN